MNKLRNLIFLLIVTCVCFAAIVSGSFAAAEPPNDYSTGNRRYFFESQCKNGQTEFILIEKGEHCNVWIDFLYQWELSAAEYSTIARNADRIYKAMCENIFPHSMSWGDVSGDKKINILLCDLSGEGLSGYYNPVDLRIRTDSNKLDIIYMDISREIGQLNLRKSDGIKFFGTFAHEFQHMLSDIVCNNINSLNDNNDLWLNELMSSSAAGIYASENSYYFNEDLLKYFLLDYGTKNGFLFTGYGDLKQKEYLMSSLFSVYLYKTNPDKNILKAVYNCYAESVYGMEALNAVLASADKNFEPEYEKFILHTYFDGLMSDTPAILEYPFGYEGEAYGNLFELRKDNDLLFSESNINNMSLSSNGYLWREKIYVFDNLSGKQYIKADGNISLYYVSAGIDNQNLNLLKYKDGIDTADSTALYIIMIAKNNSVDSTFELIDKINYKLILIIFLSVLTAGCIIAIIVLKIKKNSAETEGGKNENGKNV